MLASVLALAAFWPNLVHEPLHLLALKVQGSDGFISFDWSLPAHPSTTRTLPVAGVAGGLLFFLLPSLSSLVILGWITITRKSPTVLTHFVLPAYLGADLIWNITKPAAISDFRFVHALWPDATVLLAGIVLCATAVVLWQARSIVASSVGKVA